jgi:hypothetical protein
LNFWSSEIVDDDLRASLKDEDSRRHRFDRIVNVETGETKVEEREKMFRAGSVDVAGDENWRDGRERRNRSRGSVGLNHENERSDTTTTRSENGKTTHFGESLECRIGSFEQRREDKIRFELSHRLERRLRVRDRDRVSREH